MTYLDYAANTPVREEVLSAFCEAARAYPANPNSPHGPGKQAAARLIKSTTHILELLNLPGWELIYTSGATESNNLAIKGIAQHCRGRGKHIVTTFLEHSSVHGAAGALQAAGYEVDYVNLLPDGKIDMAHLAALLRPDTVLFSCCYADGELGVIQNIDTIGGFLKERHPNTAFHVDATQAVGKIPVSLSRADLISFAPHKFYGLNGVGALIKRPDLLLEPQMHGGRSTTAYRSGSPALALIVSMEEALRFALAELEQNLERARAQNARLRAHLKQYPDVLINSPVDALPFLLNMSVPGRDAVLFLEALEQRGFTLSGKSACTAPKAVSRPVFALTKDRRLALSTLRVSLGRWTTEEDIGAFLAAFDACYREIGRK
ncbi:MAG TPA: cysteine desulfurase family protein [Feifaniaceae bacterium]|nr:cysteine desulfurase family protein [Feifaniaceae bacterium]